MKRDDASTRQNYFESIAIRNDQLKKRNWYYYQTIERCFARIIPQGAVVCEIGCGTGDLLASVKPSIGFGIDFAESMLRIATSKYPELNFIQADATDFELPAVVDYFIISDLLSTAWDIQRIFERIRPYAHSETKIIISSHSYIWEPLLRLAELIRLKPKRPKASWLTVSDIQKVMELEDFEIIKSERKMLLPIYIPILHTLINQFLANLPWINRLGLINLISARPVKMEKREFTVSIIVPARNEKGNIEQAIQRTPDFGISQEFIFIEGHSSDGTLEEMSRVQKLYPGKNIIVMKQSGKGKGNAVREAFDRATGEVLMILDADLTTPPEELPKFYEALARNKGEFINGCRLVYPMEKQAMRFLNLVANMFFGVLFTYLLGQPLKDTLCGTKVLLKTNYEKIKANRVYFGEFDPFGDFDLLFGAAKLNLKIVEIIVRYRDRTYGSTQISRFRHGWLLLKMSAFAARKIKFVS